MPLLGNAALLLSFDIAPEAIIEHDDWHTHEHLPERLSIPGFLRGTRWVERHAEPRYLVLYEVAALETLTSPAYLERLNHPTPWTAKMMTFYRGMGRGLCSVTGSVGDGLGHLMLVVRFAPSRERESSLRKRLIEDILPRFVSRSGIGSLHLLEGAAKAPMTSEQRIRGPDASVGWALLASGYGEEALMDLAQTELSSPHLQHWGAADVTHGLYRLDYTVCQRDTRMTSALTGHSAGHRA